LARISGGGSSPRSRISRTRRINTSGGSLPVSGGEAFSAVSTLLVPPALATCTTFVAADFGSLPNPTLASSRATSVWLVDGSGGLKRSAAFGTFNTLVRCAVLMETVAVIPGLSLKSALVTPMTVS
jgi:hypothetical protein